jgi:uncharacterized Zn-binding protein involved in type VI secretion
MDIIGWVRMGDKASCGGKVAEASQVEMGSGRGYTFQGARMSCRKHCKISEGFVTSTLSSGRCKVHHGMSTSGGCTLESTLNEVDGVGGA